MPRLEGRVVATTRDGSPDDPLVQALRAEGARVLVWPTLSVRPPVDPAPLDAALADLDDFDWIVFTSARAVAPVVRRAPAPGARPRIAAVGEPTGEALDAAGWRPDIVGPGGAEALVEAIARMAPPGGRRFLFPAGSRARPTLEQALGARGAEVRRVEAYRTELTPPDAARVRADLRRGVHVVTFASPSAARSLADALGSLAAPLEGCRVVAIGPTTEEALVALGLSRVHVAARPSTEALVEACIDLAHRN